MQARIALVFLLALTLSACADTGGETRLTGQVTCPDEINPPSDAVLWLQLNELTGGIPNTIAKQSIPWPGKCPIPFEIPYDADAVNSSNTYTLLVTLETRIGPHTILYAGRRDVITFFNPTSNVKVEIEDLDWENNPSGEFGP
jgi:uncharacterized lipoprotein YbaY